ncbi:MAG: aldo/keto reductase [Petrimonas sp.]|nr:aldo/keto reductase [Petrimonas sp.]
MENKNNHREIGRRRFLQTGAKVTASAMLVGLSTPRLTSATKPDNKILPKIESITLNNGVKMPMLGFGTYSLRGEDCRKYVAQAISHGYRLIDTATVYGNEEFVGAGIKDSGINRKELFITSKVWVDDSGIEKAKKAFQTSLDKLGTDYLDLYLIHRPRGDVKGSWQAMEELYRAGKIKAIGLSNFEPHQLDELLKYATVEPTVNQIESHAFFQQNAANENLRKHNIRMEAWAPFAEGRNGLFCNPTLEEIGRQYNKTNAQVSLRWHYQRGVVAIPRTSKKYHMMENLEIFDFALSDADMEKIGTLDLNITHFPEWE